MAALKHDAQGFLVGDPIDIGRALAVWDDIRSDIRAIRKAVMGASEAAVKGGGKHADASRVITPRGGMEEADPAVKATPRGRERAASAIPARRYSDEIPSLLRKAVTPVRGQGNEVASTSAKPGASGVMVRPERKSPQSVAKPAGRDGRGRFTKGDGRPDGLLPNDAADDADTGALRSIADRIVGAVADSSGGMEEADPAVKAFNEVAQPMARGYELLTGGDSQKKQEGWLRRIWCAPWCARCIAGCWRWGCWASCEGRMAARPPSLPSSALPMTDTPDPIRLNKRMADQGFTLEEINLNSQDSDGVPYKGRMLRYLRGHA